MLDPRKEVFNPYLRAIADLMGLRDWTVGIDHDPPDSDHVASIDCRYGRKFAWVKLSEAFLDSEPDRQRQTIVHELTHCHFEPMRRLLLGLVEDNIWNAIDLPFEYGVDGVAEVMAARLPLPAEVKSDAPVAARESPGES